MSRGSRQDCQDRDHSMGKDDDSVVGIETLRRGAEAAAQGDAPKGEEKISVFWRVFGGTLLSIGALVVITLYNQFSSSMTDMRREVNQLHEKRAELLRKDEFTPRIQSIWTNLKEIQQTSQGLVTLTEKTRVLDQQLDRQARNAEDDRKEVQRKLEEQRRAAEDDRKEAQRKQEDQRKAAEAERAELTRQLEEVRKALAGERKELLGKLEEQRKLHEDERKETARSLQVLVERLAKVEGRQGSKAKATQPDE
ncbi:MAG: hypothetical protein IT429_10280 [Gemmataceae bacterium]|nr:hypothetical protein [Gemmataceae bacterium]